jgi:dihydroorotate dehydrogenase electron transfer subunit
LKPAIRNRPLMCEVESIKRQTEDTVTLKIRCPSNICGSSNPGQFLMIWIPGIDEVPMSISNVEEEEVWITVKKVGEATSAIHSIGEGGILGIRGPYGNSFTKSRGNVLMVAGGVGAAPLLFQARRLLGSNGRITLVLGAKTAIRVVLQKEFEKLFRRQRGTRLIVSTDDGSRGLKGRASDIAENLMKRDRYHTVYTCGPEAMMQKVIRVASGLGFHVEASLERYMRCGIGLCGSCYIGKYLVCKDGPVFRNDKLKEIAQYMTPAQ